MNQETSQRENEISSEERETWYIDYMGFEEYQNKTNRLVLGFRNLCRVEARTLYIKENVSIATGFLYNKNYNNIERIINQCLNNNDINDEIKNITLYASNYSLEYWKRWNEEKNKENNKKFDIIPREGNYSVLEVSIPNNKILIEKLPAEFQRGDYDRFIRFKYPYLYKKCEFNDVLSEVFKIQKSLNDYVEETINILHDYNQRNTTRLAREWLNVLYDYFQEYVQKYGDYDLDYEKVVRFVSERKGLIIKSFFNNKHFQENSEKLIVNGKEHLKNYSKAMTILNRINKEIDKDNGINNNTDNYISLNYETFEYEIVLADMSQIKILSESINSDELMNQVWVIGDIEKPLWKRIDERKRLELRDYLIGLKKGKKSRLEQRIGSLEKQLSKTRMKKRIEKLNAKIDGMKLLVKDYSREPERIDAILSKVESKLTKNIGSYEVRLWEDDYDAKISWVALIYKMRDNILIKELHTLRETGLSEINGFRIIKYQDEKDLISGIIKGMKKRKAAVFANHNLPYDVTQIRYASDELNAEPMDIFIRNIFPRRDFVRKIYQKMKKGTFEYFDTYRQAVIHHTYLRSNNPKGDHKLETFTNYLFGEGSFRKSISYEQLRELEVKAINNDEEAARIIADYVTSDVLPIYRIITETSYLKTAFKIQHKMPYLTLTEILFSPQCVRKFFHYKHWKKNHNHKYYKYEQKEREDFLQISKKRFPAIKREQFRKNGINISPITGMHELVIQAYVPFELWLKDAIKRISKEMWDYLNDLSDNPIEKFGQLQYVKAFLRDVLADYYFAMNEKIRFWNILKKVALEEKRLEDIANKLQNADNGLLNKYYTSYDKLKNQYRSIYVGANADIRKVIRQKRLHKTFPQQKLDFVYDAFREDNLDIILLKENIKAIQESLSEGYEIELKRFSSNYSTFENTQRDLCKIAESIIKEAGINIAPTNLVYAINQMRRAKEKARKFLFEYGISTDSIKKLIDEGYQRLREEISSKKVEIVMQRGDYLFLKFINHDTKISDDILIPIRLIRNFVVSKQKADYTKDQGSLFLFSDEEKSEDDMDAEDILEEIIYTEPF